MSASLTAYGMMAVGAVLALVLAAGPLADSLSTQVLFGGAISLLAAGAAARRIGAKKGGLMGSAGGEVEKAHAALTSLGQALQQAQSDCESITDMPTFHRCVDDATHSPARDFLLHRQSLLDAYGISRFAELMIRFSSVERALNRALSASADGTEAEARSCLQLANQRMENCLAARIGTEQEKGTRSMR